MFKKFLSAFVLFTFIIFSTSAYSDDGLKKTLSLTFEHNGEKITMNPWAEDPKVKVDFNTSTVYIGAIEGIQVYFDVEDATKALLLAGKKEITFNLHSPGGDVYVMNIIDKHIDLLKAKGIHIITKIDENNSCMSACVLIFLHGDERIANRRSVFMFHSPYVAGSKTNPHEALKIIEAQEIGMLRDQFRQEIINACGDKTTLYNDVYDGKDHFYASESLVQKCPVYITKLVGEKKLGNNKGF